MEDLDDIPQASPTTRNVEKEVTDADDDLELDLIDIDVQKQLRIKDEEVEFYMDEEQEKELKQLNDDPELIELEKRVKRNNEKLIVKKKKDNEAKKKWLQRRVEEQEKMLKHLNEEEITSMPVFKEEFRRSDTHLMISYSWKQQSIVMKIRKQFLAAGIKVWIDQYDWYNDDGYLVQSIVDAVKNADIVLLCMSRDYENSLFCRTEADYAFKLKKKIVPLKVEKGYKADGWLDFYTAGRYYYDFGEDYQFEDKMTKLVNWVQRSRTVHNIEGVNQGLQQVRSHRIPPDYVKEKKCSPQPSWKWGDLFNWMR